MSKRFHMLHEIMNKEQAEKLAEKIQRWLGRKTRDLTNSKKTYEVETISVGFETGSTEDYQVYITLKPLSEIIEEKMRRTETYFTFKKSLTFIGELVYKIYEFVPDNEAPMSVFDVMGENERVIFPNGLMEAQWLGCENEFDSQNDAVKYLRDANELASENGSEFVILPIWISPIQI